MQERSMALTELLTYVPLIEQEHDGLFEIQLELLDMILLLEIR